MMGLLMDNKKLSYRRQTARRV